MPEKKRQEECEDGNEQMDHRSGPRVAYCRSKATGRRSVRMATGRRTIAQEGCEGGNRQTDHRSGPRVAYCRSKPTGIGPAEA